MERPHGQRRGAKNYNPIICIPARWFGKCRSWGVTSQSGLCSSAYRKRSSSR